MFSAPNVFFVDLTSPLLEHHAGIAIPDIAYRDMHTTGAAFRGLLLGHALNVEQRTDGSTVWVLPHASNDAGGRAIPLSRERPPLLTEQGKLMRGAIAHENGVPVLTHPMRSGDTLVQIRTGIHCPRGVRRVHALDAFLKEKREPLPHGTCTARRDDAELVAIADTPMPERISSVSRYAQSHTGTTFAFQTDSLWVLPKKAVLIGCSLSPQPGIPLVVRIRVLSDHPRLEQGTFSEYDDFLETQGIANVRKVAV